MGIMKKVPKKFDKELYIIRGLPGSGRTCLSKGILISKTGVILSSDDYFYENNIYTYNSMKVNEAIESTIINCEESCKNGILCIIIDDSNIKRWEVRPYVELAKRYNYKVIIREPETTWWKTRDLEEMSKRTSHNISIQAMKKLLQSWDVDFSINSILKEEIPINKIDSLYKYYNCNFSMTTTITTTTSSSSSSTLLASKAATSSTHSSISSNDPATVVNTTATTTTHIPGVVEFRASNSHSNIIKNGRGSGGSNERSRSRSTSRNNYVAPKIPRVVVNNPRPQPPQAPPQHYYKEKNPAFNDNGMNINHGKKTSSLSSSSSRGGGIIPGHKNPNERYSKAYSLSSESTTSSSSSKKFFKGANPGRANEKIGKRRSNSMNGHNNYQKPPPPPLPHLPSKEIPPLIPQQQQQPQHSNPYRVCRPAVQPYSDNEEDEDMPPYNNSKYDRRNRSENSRSSLGRGRGRRCYDDSVIPAYNDISRHKNDEIYGKRKRSSSIGENDIYNRKRNRNSSIGAGGNNGRYDDRSNSIDYSMTERSSSLGYKKRISNSNNSRGIDYSRYGGVNHRSDGSLDIGSSRRSSSVGNEDYGYYDRLNASGGGVNGRYNNEYGIEHQHHQHLHQHQHQHQHQQHHIPPPPLSNQKKKGNSYYTKTTTTTSTFGKSIPPPPPHPGDIHPVGVSKSNYRSNSRNGTSRSKSNSSRSNSRSNSRSSRRGYNQVNRNRY